MMREVDDRNAVEPLCPELPIVDVTVPLAEIPPELDVGPPAVLATVVPLLAAPARGRAGIGVALLESG